MWKLILINTRLFLLFIKGNKTFTFVLLYKHCVIKVTVFLWNFYIFRKLFSVVVSICEIINFNVRRKLKLGTKIFKFINQRYTFMSSTILTNLEHYCFRKGSRCTLYSLIWISSPLSTYSAVVFHSFIVWIVTVHYPNIVFIKKLISVT